MSTNGTPGGWTGKVLRVNLSTGRIGIEPTNMQWAHDYVGGRGLGAKYLAEEMSPTVDPLSPDNKMIFATGPLTGTNASCGSRYMVVTKGLQTGTITTSNSGGHWGPELKFAGFDLLIVEGKSAKPVFINIYNDEVEIRDAAQFWGKTVFETDDGIKRELSNPDAVVACIGPAGENLVKFACIINDKHRAAGRSGVGAVMGSKNLKAIAVRGTNGVKLSRPKEFLEASWAKKAKLKGHPVTGEGLAVYGTQVLMNVINETRSLPTRNFTGAHFEGANKIGGETLKDTRLLANKACFACTIACGRVNKLGDGSDKFMVTTHPRNWKIATEGPEYEPAWALGADTGVDDLDAIIKANYMCNELGMDPISLGSTIASAMEMYETGVLSANDGIDIPLKFGSGDALVAYTERTAFREGFGNEIAEGAKRMCDKYGAPDLFMGVKGSEFPAYDPRAIQGIGLAYATSNRGACHLKAYTIAPEILGIPEKLDPTVTENKAFWTKLFQDATALVDATGECLFVTFGIHPVDDVIPELNAATGMNLDQAGGLTIGERIWNLERIWNQKAGITGKDDTLPKRMLNDPIPDEGPTKGKVSGLATMLPEYYALRGWTPTGEPTAEKLASLGLG